MPFSPTESARELRRRAEEKLALSSASNSKTLAPVDPQRLLHEMQVHQIELEMQNEELRNAIAERDEKDALLGTYQDLYEFAPAGYFNLDRNGIINAVNLTGTALLGAERGMLINNRLDAFISKETRPAFHDFLKKVFASDVKESCEVVFVTKNHSPLFVQIEAIAAKTRMNCRAVVMDITARKQAGEALRLSEERYRGLVEQTPEGIFVADAQGRYLDVNPAGARMLGYTQEEICRMGIADVLAPEEMARIPEALDRLAGGAVDHNEWRFKRKDGSFFIGEVVGLQLPDGRLQGILRDVTARKQAEAMLKDMNKELEIRVAERTRELAKNMEMLRVETTERIKAVEDMRDKERMLIQQSRQAAMGEVIGNIAHQWRQPLNVVGLQIQQLQVYYDLGLFDKEFLDKNVAGSMEIIQHMSKTIDDFLDYFKPDKERTEFNVHEAIKTVLSLLEGSLKSPLIDVEVVVNDDPAIYGFPNEFTQVILNIMNNARDVFIERAISSPKVTINICNENGCAVVTIADNAGGIPENIINKVFDPYFTTKGPQHGTGVGLFMSKTIIEKNMGGRLNVRNVANGAEFRIDVENRSHASHEEKAFMMLAEDETDTLQGGRARRQ